MGEVGTDTREEVPSGSFEGGSGSCRGGEWTVPVRTYMYRMGREEGKGTFRGGRGIGSP